MANPMQRRAKASFLLGFLLAAIIMALIVGVLVVRMNGIQEEKEALERKQKTVYVASLNLESGAELESTDLKQEQVQTTVADDEIVNASFLGEVDPETGETLKYKVKVNIPAGTIITKDMIYTDDDATTNDQRIQEYNMIVLPSQLKNGDYVDIRMKIPSGEDYIVLSKKKVEGTTATTLWIKVTEDEILSLNNAIVEAWMMEGSEIYAISYTEPGMQTKATQTYPISAETYEQINSNPNVVEKAKTALAQRYTDSLVNQRNNRINPILQEYMEDRDSSVSTGILEEVQKMQEAREEYITALEGSDEIGYNADN